MARQPFAQRIVGRLHQRRGVGGELVHLLRHPATHHRIVAIEPQPQRLAMEHLLAQPALDQRIEFRPRRRAAGLRLEAGRKLGQLGAAQRDRAVRRIDRLPTPGEQ